MQTNEEKNLVAQTSLLLKKNVVALIRAVCLMCVEAQSFALLGAGVLGDSLGSLADGVLGQLSGQQKTHCRLDFPARDGRAPIVVSQTRRLGGDALEDVVDERVHDRHGLAADARIGMDLLQHLVDVDGVALLSPPPVLLVSGANGFRFAGGLLGTLASWFRRHA